MKLGLIFVTLLPFTHRLAEAEINPAHTLPTVAILPLLNLSAGTNEDHWGTFIPELLSFELAESKSLVPAPNSSIQYGLRYIGSSKRRPVTIQQAKDVGVVLKAQLVVWGDYRHEGGDWVVELNVIKPDGDGAPIRVVASAKDWPRAAFMLTSNLSQTIGVANNSAAWTWANGDQRRASAALEFTSRAASMRAHGARSKDLEAMLRRATALEPRLFIARLGLCLALLQENRLDQAAQEVERAMQIRPHSPWSFSTLGWLELSKGEPVKATDAFLQAVRLDDTSYGAYFGLGTAYQAQSRVPLAISAWQRAETLAPYDAEIHADLMYTYASFGDRSNALREVDLTMRSAAIENWRIEASLGRGYEALGELSKAIEHYERFVEAATKAGLRGAEIDEVRQYLSQLRAHEVVHFVNTSSPPVFTPIQLREQLHRTLSAREYRMVEDPLATTSEMKECATKFAGHAKGELDMARQLFRAVALHVNASAPERRGQPATAEKAFELWRAGTNSLTCEDYTFLYVALARLLDLKADYVLVKRDCDGQEVTHACAGLIIDGKGVLVDPLYHWFGVPHVEYRFMNDIEAEGLFLINCGLCSDDFSKQRAGLKLVPDCANAHLLVALGQVFPRDFKVRIGVSSGARPTVVAGVALSPPITPASALRAERELRVGLALAPENSIGLFVRAVLSISRGNEWDSALSDLRRVSDANPYIPAITARLQWVIAAALVGGGRIREARTQCQRIELAPTSDAEEKTWAAKLSSAIDALPTTSTSETRHPRSLANAPKAPDELAK